MAYSRRTFGLGAFAGMFGLAGAARAAGAEPATDRHLRLADQPEDYKAFGIGQEIQVSEDGRRTEGRPEDFEWWYFDGLLDDGSVVVIWFGDNWFYGSHKRAISIDITPPGGKPRRLMKTFEEPGTFARDHADVRIGPHRFEGDLKTYRIHIDAAQFGGTGCNLVLRQRIASYRPATGHMLSGDRFFAWLVAVPEGDVSGDLTIDGVTKTVSGSGYHDHNWGNVSPRDLFDGWWWGRARIGTHTTIASQLYGRRELGGVNINLLYVGDEGSVKVNAFGRDVIATEGQAIKHPDPKHDRPIAGSIVFATPAGDVVQFNASDQLLTSANLLDDAPAAIRTFAQLAGMKPWYTRFKSQVSLGLRGQPAEKGEGTLERFEFK
jgi:hypothetical protein